MKLNILSKIHTWTVLLFVPLSLYVTPISKVTYGDILLLADVLLMLFYIYVKKLNLKKVISVPLVYFSCFLLIHSLIMMLLCDWEFVDMFSLLRYLLYLMAAVLGARTFLPIDYFINVYVKLALIFATYAVLQSIFYNLFTIILPTNILGLSTYDSIYNLSSSTSLDMYVSSGVYRVRSVFLEPATYGVYITTILNYLLNFTENTRKKYALSVYLSLTILMVGSATGNILMVLCWSKTVYQYIKKISIHTLLLIVGDLAVVYAVFNSTYLWTTVITRVVGMEEAGGAFQGRMGQVVHSREGWVDIHHL